MDVKQRIDSLAALGEYLVSPAGREATDRWAGKAEAQNRWFTLENVRTSLASLAMNYLVRSQLTRWAANYPLETVRPRRVGVVMAGNIPAVGFHDLLCVLVSGHGLWAKLSSQDSVLLPEMAGVLLKIQPAWAGSIRFVERLNEVEAIIATGSDNSARYFRHYFGNRPHLIRQNRTACAVLRGNETTADLTRLGGDLLQYFGLGCRSVSKLFVPPGYDFNAFFGAVQPLEGVIQHTKYRNNYDYNKSILLVNGARHLDNGFLLVAENQSLVSPVSVVYFEEYRDEADLTARMTRHQDRIQCTVAAAGWYPGSVPFGTAQAPGLTDYADQVDTMRFLATLPNG
ncbi:MAG: acyl-CoA reductase [Ferruginibacter sp.]|nr:acyl-CoA reductase [Cytophagales bacterium]